MRPGNHVVVYLQGLDFVTTYSGRIS
jgi:hypothetical protein